MKCEICKKNQASFYEFVPALARQAPVCVACHSRGLVYKSNIFDFLEETFSIQDQESRHTIGKAVCPNCGFEFDDYFETGRFGCVKCYDTFHDKITQIVGEIHGCTHHNGSRPK